MCKQGGGERGGRGGRSEWGEQMETEEEEMETKQEDMEEEEETDRREGEGKREYNILKFRRMVN